MNREQNVEYATRNQVLEVAKTNRLMLHHLIRELATDTSGVNFRFNVLLKSDPSLEPAMTAAFKLNSAVNSATLAELKKVNYALTKAIEAMEFDLITLGYQADSDSALPIEEEPLPLEEEKEETHD